FSSAHAALTFAFNYSAQAVERPMMARMADKGGGSGKGLGGLDGAGQAGMILSKVKSLSRLHQAIFRARFGERVAKCPCCGSPADDLEWLSAIRVISDHAVAAALSSHLTSRLLRDAIVARYFGKKVLLHEVAERVGVSSSTASNHNSKIIRWLRGTNSQINGSSNSLLGEEPLAMLAISELLSAGGVCP
uniref:hypothetical protein n=1 Tax=Agrobacterium tumefaciens TaxID=358 RepID=UPI003BA1764B